VSIFSHIETLGKKHPEEQSPSETGLRLAILFNYTYTCHETGCVYTYAHSKRYLKSIIITIIHNSQQALCGGATLEAYLMRGSLDKCIPGGISRRSRPDSI
jgi:hypothetical protein